MGERRLGNIKRISLAGLAEGWDECYVLSTPVTYGQLLVIKEINTGSITEDEAVQVTVDFVKEHISGGKVLVLDDNNDLVSSDLIKEDVDEMSVEMVGHIFGQMTTTGAQYVDPKDSTRTTLATTASSEVLSPQDAPITTT